MKVWKKPNLTQVGINATETCPAPRQPWYCCGTTFETAEAYLAHQAGPTINGYEYHCGMDLQLS